MISSTTSCGTARTTSAMVAPSSITGMTSATRIGRSETPAQAAVGAGRGRRVAEQPGAERAVLLPVPNLAQALLGGVAECEGVVTAHRERRNAARQRAAVGGEIHQGPRPR